MSALRHLLWPLALAYGTAVQIRHWAYDFGIFKSQRAVVKTLALGNVALGGTGKTPHTGYVLKHLSAGRNWAFLSRGYGRKTKGFRRVNPSDIATDVGDEPLMLASKFPEVPCFVGERRLEAIQNIQCMIQPDVVVLDDALQHRELRPDCSIMLTTWNKPFYNDYLVPVGGLRDLRMRVASADALIITKCPDTISDQQRSDIQSALESYDLPVFYTKLVYGMPLSLNGKDIFNPEDPCHLVSGIADGSLFEQEMRRMYRIEKHWAYGDHYNFSVSEVNQWSKSNSGQYVTVLTTEKDAARIKSMALPETLRIFYMPIEIAFIGDKEDQRFESLVLTKLK